MSDETVQVRITGDSSGAEAAMGKASEAVSSGVDKMQESFEGIGGALQDIQEKFTTAFKVTGIAAAYEAVKQITEAVEQLAERAVHMNTLSDVLGVTVEQFQAMSLAAEEAGVSDQTFARAGERMVALLYQARDGSGAAIEKLLQLGVTTAQVRDHTFNLNALLQILHDRLNDSSTAQGTMNALIAELGPRAALAAEAIKNYDGSVEGVQRVMDRLNGLTREQTTELKEELAAFKALGTYVENTLTKAYLGAVDATSRFLSVLLAPAPSSPALAGIFGSSAAPDTSAQTAKARQTTDALQEVIVTAHATTLAELQSAQELIASYRQGSAERLAAVQQYYNLAVQYYGSAEVDKVRAAHKDLIAEERAYRQAQLDAANEAARVMQELDKKTVEALQHDMKEIATSAAASAKEQEEAQVGAISRQLEAVHAAAATHQLTGQQELQQTIALLAQEWSAEQDYFSKLRALYAGDQAELDKIDKQEEAAHQKHLGAMQKAEEKGTADILKTWQTIGAGVANAWASNVDKMLRGTETLGQGMKSIFTEMGASMIETLVKVLIQQEVNALVSKALGQETAKSNILAHAAEAAAGAMASAAAIPYIGWILAPIEGAAIYAAALAFPSAEGGFDIPAGANPITQLHSSEMVLPAQIANTFRVIAAQNGGGGGAGPPPKVNISVDGQMGDFFIVHRDKLAGAINQLVRERHIGAGRAF